MPDWILDDNGIQIPHISSTPSTPPSGSTQIFADSANGSIYQRTPDGTVELLASAIKLEIAHFMYHEPKGTAGDITTSGAWRTMTLDETVVAQPWATLSTNEVTLTTGKYLFYLTSTIGNAFGIALEVGGSGGTFARQNGVHTTGEITAHHWSIQTVSGASEKFSLAVATWQTVTQANNNHGWNTLGNFFNEMMIIKVE
jgi:hypothetical protein